MVVSNSDLVKQNPLYQRLIDNDPAATYPWPDNLEEIAAEEEEIPIPCGYSYALHIMETSIEQQIAEFKELLRTHIGGYQS